MHGIYHGFAAPSGGAGREPLRAKMNRRRRTMEVQMIPGIARIAIVVALLGIGWLAGRAQTSQPDFELVVDAPEGFTMIQCVRGCTLAFVERGVNPRSKPMPTFKFACRGAADSRCSSRKVGGWIDKP